MWRNGPIQKLLVIGSNSFGGASLVDVALDVGLDVFGASRSPQPHPVLRPYGENARIDAFTFLQIDINRDFDRLMALIDEVRPDAIIDFAGQGMVAQSWDQPEQWYQTNIVAKVCLHKALTERDFLKAYVRVSTPEVYGSTDSLVKEDAAYNPSTPYAVSHAATDMSLAAFHRQYGLPVMLARFANFYGPGQQLYRIVPRAAICAAGLDRLTLDGGGKSVRAFIHGRDVANGILAMLQKGELGEAYHFSTDEFVSIRELVEVIAEISDVDMNTFTDEGPDRPGKDAAYFMDFGKARTELDWSPQVSLREGLEQTISWVKSSLAEIAKLPKDYIHAA